MEKFFPDREVISSLMLEASGSDHLATSLKNLPTCIHINITCIYINTKGVRNAYHLRSLNMVTGKIKVLHGKEKISPQDHSQKPRCHQPVLAQNCTSEFVALPWTQLRETKIFQMIFLEFLKIVIGILYIRSKYFL